MYDLHDNVRLTTLMHDMQYRAQNCCQQSSYNQPPHTSFYLSSDAPLPERPNVKVLGAEQQARTADRAAGNGTADRTGYAASRTGKPGRIHLW